LRPDEDRTFEDAHAVLDPNDEEQLALWAARYQVQPDELQEICDQVGGHRMHVELKLAAPRP